MKVWKYKDLRTLLNECESYALNSVFLYLKFHDGTDARIYSHQFTWLGTKCTGNGPHPENLIHEVEE